jgi:hypothetical protein
MLVAGCAVGTAENAGSATDPVTGVSTRPCPITNEGASSQKPQLASAPERADGVPSEPASSPLNLSDLFQQFWTAEADTPLVPEEIRPGESQEIVLASASMPELSPRLQTAATLDTALPDCEQPLLPSPEEASLAESMWGDCCNCYSPPTLAGLGLGIGLAAILANTDLDHKIQYDDQEDARYEEGDEWSSVTKTMGEGCVVLPIYLSAVIVDRLMPEDFRGGVVTAWGERSLRATIVGAPSMLLLQRVLGASRPTEDPLDSRWSFWADDNGVSGHAFMGAIPLLTAAKMTDNPWLKVAGYGGSLAVAWSRLNDNDHFPSQVAMGWWLAYLATSAVDETDRCNERWRLVPLPVPDGVGFSLEYQR